MKEFVEKLIKRFNELPRFYSVDNGNMVSLEDVTGATKALAEEYKTECDSICSDNGWIACSERLPEEKEDPITQDYVKYPVMTNINGSVDIKFYFYGAGHWWHGGLNMDKYITHWMDIKPVQPKGEPRTVPGTWKHQTMSRFEKVE